MPNERRWLKAAEVAEICGIHVKSVYRACRAQKLPHAKVPGIGLRIDKLALDALLADQGRARK